MRGAIVAATVVIAIAAVLLVVAVELLSLVVEADAEYPDNLRLETRTALNRTSRLGSPVGANDGRFNHLVFTDNDGKVLRYARWNTSTAIEYQNLSVLDSDPHGDPTIACGPGGMIIVAWTDIHTGVGHICMRVSEDYGSSFSDIRMVGGPEEARYQSNPAVAVTSDSTIHVAFGLTFTAQLGYASSTDGGVTFSDIQTFDSTEQNHYYAEPVLLIGPSDELQLFCIERDYDVYSSSGLCLMTEEADGK